MKLKVAVLVMMTTSLLAAADVHALSGGGGHARARQEAVSGAEASGAASRRSSRTPLPEPSTLYAAATSLAVLSGASWYIRRRK